MAAHFEKCARCGALLEQRTALAAALRSLPVAGPRAGFTERVLALAPQLAAAGAAGATATGGAGHAAPTRNRPGAGRRLPVLAAAAVLVVAVAAALLLRQPLVAPSTGIPEVTIALHEVTPVSLVFSAEGALDGARLSLKLPEGLELAGHHGRSELAWRTDLAPGRNVLRLPLVGHTARSGEVMATLAHERGTKTFRLKVTVM